jgi:predicted MPP superfamily phosphohydrolase
MLGFFLVVCALWTTLHVYVAYRFVAPTALRGAWRVLAYLVFVPGALSVPPVFFAAQLFTPEAAYVYRWIVWSYVGLFSTLFGLLAARDFALFALRACHARKAKAAGAAQALALAERRRFLLKASNGALSAISAGLTVYGMREARRLPEVVEVEIPIKNLPPALHGYHIVQLSDVHVGETIDKDFILPIVEAVTSLAPDLLVLTGDLVDGSVADVRADISPLAYLRARDGVFCVTGNHEYYSGVEAWCQEFRALGMTVLNNEHALITRDGARLLLAGVTDVREGRKHPGHTSDPAKALQGAPQHDLRILLAHQPSSARAAHKLGYALQLSGHTHGGQYFPWNLLVGLVQPIGQGLEKVGSMWVYVNRGTCYWGPPVRSFVPAEITSLKLVRT